MLSAAPAWSLACRLLMLTSLAYDSINTITVEFVTPSYRSTNAVAFCMPVAPGTLRASLTSLVEGGTQFEQSSAQLVTDSSNLMSNSFFGASHAWDRPPLHYVNMSDLVGWSSSRPGPGLGATRSAGVTISQMWKAVFAASAEHFEKQAMVGWTQGCFVVAGAWKSLTKYTMSFSLSNPPSSYKVATKPLLWMAPVTITTRQRKKGNITVSYSIRGNSLGNACIYRPGLLINTPKYFDACIEAEKRGAQAANLDRIQSCVSYLKNAGNPAGPPLDNTFPFNQMPFYTPDQGSSAAVCPAQTVPSNSTPGECIDCNEGTIQDGACRCPANMLAQPVGLLACGGYLSPSGQATSAAEVANELCNNVRQIYEAIQQGKLSDRVVAKQLLPAFASQARFLIDWEGVLQANDSFWQLQKADPRAAGAASRSQGIAPNCDQCVDGKFVDIFSGKLVPVHDDRFQAVQALRLVGYILAHAGHECKGLYSSPHLQLKDLYQGKPYDSTICKPMPA